MTSLPLPPGALQPQPTARVRGVRAEADPGFGLCGVCEPPGSGRMNLHGYGVPHKKGFGRRVRCCACDGEGQTRFVVKEPERVKAKRVRRYGAYWKEGELKILEEHFEKLDRDKLKLKLPGRTWRSIRAKGSSLGLSRLFKSNQEKYYKPRPRKEGPGSKWTPEELKILEDHFATDTKDELMRKLPIRAWTSIGAKGRAIGLSRVHIHKPRKQQKEKLPAEPRARVEIEKPWTHLEDAIINSNLRYCTYKQLDRMIQGHSIEEIKDRAKQLGLVKGRQ